MGNLDQSGDVGYLAIIRRAEFTELFKYGWLFLPHSVRFDKPMRAGEDREQFDELVRWMPVYEYSTEYLLIRFRGSEEDILVRTVTIEQVEAVYALDERARRELSGSFDPRIKIQLSVWEEWFLERLNESTRAQFEQGVTAIWSLFGLSDDDKRACEETITSEIRDCFFDLAFTGRRPSGKLSPWVYLLLYNRRPTYARAGIIRCFLNYVHVYLNFHKGKELDIEVDEQNIDAVKLLNRVKSEKFSAFQRSIENSKLHVQADEIVPGFHHAAPLFFYLKECCSEGFDVKLLENGMKEALTTQPYQKLALYLLGLVLGYDKLYDVYYDHVALQIFSDPPVASPSISSGTSATSPVDTVPGADQSESSVASSSISSGTSATTPVETLPEADQSEPPVASPSISSGTSATSPVETVPEVDQSEPPVASPSISSGTSATTPVETLPEADQSDPPVASPSISSGTSATTPVETLPEVDQREPSVASPSISSGTSATSPVETVPEVDQSEPPVASPSISSGTSATTPVETLPEADQREPSVASPSISSGTSATSPVETVPEVDQSEPSVASPSISTGTPATSPVETVPEVDQSEPPVASPSISSDSKSSPVAWMSPKGKRLGSHTSFRPAFSDEEKRRYENEGHDGVPYVSLRKEQFKCKCVKNALQQQGYDAQNERMRLFPDVKRHLIEQTVAPSSLFSQ